MLYSTRLLIAKLTPIIFESLEKHPNYKIIVTGHSLGAGVSGLFTLLFHHEHPSIPIHGYPFASPCTMSAGLSEDCRDYVTTTVLADDLVPRISYGYVEACGGV